MSAAEVDVREESRAQEFTEGTKVRLDPAPVGKRVLAAAIDLGIISAVIYLTFYALLIPAALLIGGTAFLGSLTGNGGMATGIVAILVLLIVLILMMGGFHYYYVHFEFKSGATPGKKLMGLRVISIDGRKLTKGQAIYRELVRWYVDAIFGIPAAISMAMTDKRQRVGDVLAGTMVVYSKAREESHNFLYVRQEDFRVLSSHLNPAPIPLDVRTAYMRFAYNMFIAGQENALAIESAEWVKVARNHLMKTEELGLNDNTVLRYFAELCMQQERETHG